MDADDEDDEPKPTSVNHGSSSRKKLKRLANHGRGDEKNLQRTRCKYYKQRRHDDVKCVLCQHLRRLATNGGETITEQDDDGGGSITTSSDKKELCQKSVGGRDGSGADRGSVVGGSVVGTSDDINKKVEAVVEGGGGEVKGVGSECKELIGGSKEKGETKGEKNSRF